MDDTTKMVRNICMYGAIGYVFFGAEGIAGLIILYALADIITRELN